MITIESRDFVETLLTPQETCGGEYLLHIYAGPSSRGSNAWVLFDPILSGDIYIRASYFISELDRNIDRLPILILAEIPSPYEHISVDIGNSDNVELYWSLEDRQERLPIGVSAAYEAGVRGSPRRLQPRGAQRFVRDLQQL